MVLVAVVVSGVLELQALVEQAKLALVDSMVQMAWLLWQTAAAVVVVQVQEQLAETVDQAFSSSPLIFYQQ